MSKLHFQTACPLQLRRKRHTLATSDYNNRRTLNETIGHVHQRTL
ncbi:hypothetical protein NEIELOOT_00020 [Neisseria elongata subsp. glycolytica ATCC 29315]|uniref:Uncharacterized protein n=1 Tax=Neisseria elongata subsp. glycolytica ATCC 29315 TaxID=546263 RepID=D4DLW1_NEIEG|nr:hypothetical protein NEIELOOT_00020 [Neisseria elongata subsp. glycolytica ATCC 29315]